LNRRRDPVASLPIVLAAAIGLVAAPALAGCLGSDTVESTFYVKDAPTDEFDEIWITFSKVEVHHADGDEGGDDGGDAGGADGQGGQGGARIAAQHGGGGGGSWVTTVDEARTVDLLGFNSSDAKAFLGSGELETGKYTRIRIHIDEAYGIQDGNNETITVTSGTAMVNRPFDVEDNDSTPQFVIDLDLDQSLDQQSGGDWRMNPIIGKVVTNYVEDDPEADQGGAGMGQS
jgi:hypothetical protein